MQITTPKRQVLSHLNKNPQVETRIIVCLDYIMLDAEQNGR